MIYNDLQETVLALLDHNKASPVEALQFFIAERADEQDIEARVMAALINVDLGDSRAGVILSGIFNHHREMAAALGRNVDLRTAALDYLVINPTVLHNPTVADLEMLKTTQRLAAIDEVTGLFNRHFLETYLTKELKRAQRYDQVFSVLFLDLDDFKRINDSYGHAVGDKVLATLGGQITDLLRQEDFAARYGGEEFVVTLPQTDTEGAESFGNRLRESLGGLDIIPGVQVTFSAGVASYPRHGLSVDDILQRADAALYDAKLAGKDRVIVSDADKRASTRYRTDIPVIAYAGESKLDKLRLTDVSAEGYSLVSHRMLEPGQMLRVHLHTVEAQQEHEYEVLAHVVWSRRVTGEGPYRVGGQWDPPRNKAAAEIVRSVTAAQAS